MRGERREERGEWLRREGRQRSERDRQAIQFPSPGLMTRRRRAEP